MERRYTAGSRAAADRTKIVHMQKYAGALLLTLAMVGCTVKAPPPPVKAIATREEIMHHLVIPNAQIVWGAVGTIMTVGATVEKSPKTDDEWFAVESAATVLMEAGNLLMLDGRAMDRGKWFDYSTQLRTSADTVRQAAKKHDAEALFTRGGDLFEACQACHFTYRFEKDPKTMRTH